MAIVVKFDTSKVQGMLKRVGKIPDYVNKGGLDFCKESAKQLKISLKEGTKLASRESIAQGINARKISKSESVVTMPMKGVMLDSMKPHYVSLKRGRLITKWVQRYYGFMTKAKRSRVYFGPKGGVKGYLYVTPDPFIERALMRANAKLPDILNRSIRNAMKGGV